MYIFREREIILGHHHLKKWVEIEVLFNLQSLGNIMEVVKCLAGTEADIERIFCVQKGVASRDKPNQANSTVAESILVKINLRTYFQGGCRSMKKASEDDQRNYEGDLESDLLVLNGLQAGIEVHALDNEPSSSSSNNNNNNNNNIYF